MRASKARAGRRTGEACHRPSNPYGKRQGKGIRRSRPRSSTTLPIDLLEDALNELKKDAAAGIDGLTWKAYDANLKRNLEDLHARLHRGAYRGAAEPAGIHTKAGWPTASARGRRTRRQNRPEVRSQC